MQTSVTSVLERRTPMSDTHYTHPYEVAWALEAIAFVQVEGIHPVLHVTPQISPDGINWVDGDDAISIPERDRLAFLRVSHHGSWLRFRIEGGTAVEPAVVMVHLTLKG